MAEVTNVVIGIQARSTSNRLPGKALELIDGKPMIQHVIDSCSKAARYINNFNHRTRTHVRVAMVVPEGDELARTFRNRCHVIEGPEHDVLARYLMLAKHLEADYLVRITGDCPLIPPYMITKHIKIALVNGYDYLSNVDEEFRLSVDGNDVEVISRRLVVWAGETAKEARDREHVTTIIRRETPSWAKVGHVFGFMDLSNVKLSVDTSEDLERVRAHYQVTKDRIAKWEEKHGRGSAHRL
jgi:spore coat polysaccharide biosynthesis protein SpsF (cytidylyltransferase family)